MSDIWIITIITTVNFILNSTLYIYVISVIKLCNIVWILKLITTPGILVMLVLLISGNHVFFKKASLLKSQIYIYFVIVCFISFLDIYFNDSTNSLFIYNYTHDFFILNNFDSAFGGDSITLIFLFLTNSLFLVALLISFNNIKYNLRLFLFLLIFLQICILSCLLSLNIFFFYFFFEISLIPMFFIISLWGSKPRKIYATYQFIFYTMLGSIFLLSGIFYLYYLTGTLNILILNNISFDTKTQIILWFLFFIGFSTKIPMLPFHAWLPEAHVEAPASGSIILAGILLKLGTYGIYRFVVPLYPYANNYFLTFIYCWTIFSIIYVSLLILRQIDLKKIIAYSSIIHMNIIVIGLFASSIEGLTGSIFLMISHGIVSAGLFSLIGMLYDRYKTRNVIYYSSLVTNMPIFSVFFMFFTLCNLGFPATSNFIGELLVVLSVIDDNLFVTFLLCCIINFGTIYCIWLCNRLLFGELQSTNINSDLTEREIFILVFISFFVLLLGLQPNFLINYIQMDLLLYLEYLNN